MCHDEAADGWLSRSSVTTPDDPNITLFTAHPQPEGAVKFEGNKKRAPRLVGKKKLQARQSIGGKSIGHEHPFSSFASDRPLVSTTVVNQADNTR